jgi:hypothetical protein
MELRYQFVLKQHLVVGVLRVLSREMFQISPGQFSTLRLPSGPLVTNYLIASKSHMKYSRLKTPSDSSLSLLATARLDSFGSGLGQRTGQWFQGGKPS